MKNRVRNWLVLLTTCLGAFFLWVMIGLEGKDMEKQMPWSQAAYIWESADLLDAQKRGSILEDLKKAGMDRLYLGLNREESTAAAADAHDLEALLGKAAAEGFTVELLLGEPLWMMPEHRQDLLDLITDLAHFPFDRLHLDLEVDQLPGEVTAQRLQDWLDTLAAAVAVSPWPVSIDSHHRWFHSTPDIRPCVPCALPAIGVSEVSIMLYVTNVQRSSEIMRNIARNWPELGFRLAQSVESNQPSNISWHGKTRPELQDKAQAWRDALAPEGIGGLDWQDWQSYPAQN